MAKEIDWLKIENRIKATPLDLLKQGIVRRQWEAVESAYTMLTGIVLKPKTQVEEESTVVPVDEPISPAEEVIEDEQKEIEDEGDLDEVVDEPDEEEDEDNDNDYEHTRKKNSKIRTRSSQVRAEGINLFKPDETDAAEDVAFMPKGEALKKCLRKPKRPEYKKVKVRCSKCGEQESVDPVVAAGSITKNKESKMRYVCNECSCGGR